MKLVEVTGTGHRYTIGKIVCIGRNYADHIKELGNATPESPVIFMKPATAVIGNGETIIIPSYSNECHHEIELAILIGRSGKNIAAGQAFNHIAGYGVAIDLTLRDVQSELKKKGLPWEIAKGFDTSCPLSSFVPASTISNPQELRLVMKVNGEVRQDGSTAMMIHHVPELIAHMSSIFTLEEGDIILTGTPAGVSAIAAGDVLVAEIPGIISLQVSVGHSQYMN